VSDWPTEEEDLRTPVRDYFAERGYTVRDEVWINGRIADLYAYQDDTEVDPVAIELKLTDWKKATRQAMAYQLGAVYTYVALPVLHVHNVMRQSSALRSRNVGLLGVAPPAGSGFAKASEEPDFEEGEPDVRELIEPGPSDRYLPFLAEKIQTGDDRSKQKPTRMPRKC